MKEKKGGTLQNEGRNKVMRDPKKVIPGEWGQDNLTGALLGHFSTIFLSCYHMNDWRQEISSRN